MIERRRLLLMRHGAVDYFAADGRPLPPDEVPLTPAGIEQARAMGSALAAAGVRIDRAITSGLACVHYGVAETTQDCDLLCHTASFQTLLDLLQETRVDDRWHRGP